ncbi:MAG: UvrB/UvrC motif-containing protein [Clostridiales bacterium]|jgi:protein arginine kinase activator|nr:UvrB/UvrC motif-containing protein [Clostridiales bacterium]
MALCDQCKQNTADVHVEEILNNVKYEYNLCSKCAQNFNTDHSFDHFFKNLLEAMFVFQAEPSSKTAFNAGSAACGACGLTYAEFTQTSRFGCANCYDAFRPQIETVLKNIQGSNRHEGKYPHKNSAALILQKQIGEMKTALKKAVETEDFEQAAILRDRIKELQNG